MKSVSASTTAPASRATLLARSGFLLVPPEVVVSPDSKIAYRVDRMVGEGGYGQAYLATRLGRARSVPSIVCIKASPHIEGWLREAYFGQLLDGTPQAIRVFDAFPLMRADGAVLYCLALEYARHGDLRAFLHRTGKAWTETAARRQIAGILQVLGTLHRGQLLHRDLTPMNVFVCDGQTLKLGDFGIVRHLRDRRGIRAHTLNRLTAPLEILDGAAPMDARLDPAGIAGLREGDAQILRNAGGRASNDAIRSLVISCKLLGTREWVVIHHTGCGMESLTDAAQRSRFTASLRPENAGPPVAQADGDADEFFEADDLQWLEIRGVRERLSAAVNRIRTHPLLPPGVLVHGLLYDVATGRLEVVDQA